MTRRRGLSRLLPAVLLALLIVSCLPSSAQGPGDGNIVGQIRVARGSFPAERIQVTLQTRGQLVNQSWTDNEGKFAFYGLPANLYHVIISDERYEYYEEYVKVNPRIAQTNIINIQLTPKAPEQGDIQPSAVAGGNPYLVDPAEYRNQFPKKVVKEFEEGVKCQADGRIDDAIKHFQAALKLSPGFYPAHNNLGTAYLGQRNFTAAQAEFETVLKLNQSDTQAYFNLGNVYFLTRRFGEAERVLGEGLRRQPNAALGHLLLGSVLARTERLREAERELHKAQELDPLLSQVRLELVNLYLPQHRVAEAIEQLKLFLQRFPADPMAPKAREVLARLEASVSAKKQ